jgi:hypothetical protein
MNELIQQIVSKVGVSEDQAQGSIGMVVQFIKAKLPENLHGVLDSVMSGEEIGDSAGIADMAKGAIGGIFGGK